MGHIRWMIRIDMPEVLDIENKSFESSWSEDDFLTCLRNRNCIGMVNEDCKPNEYDGANFDYEQIKGFMLYELHKTKLHILNFAVHPGYRRQGIGREMVDLLQRKLSNQRRTSITLEVRESNLPAQLFFREHGFKAINTLKNFYDNTSEDAYSMRYDARKEGECLIDYKISKTFKLTG